MATHENVNETAYIGARVPKELHERFTELADSEDRSVSAELRRAIERWADPDAVRDRNGGK